MIMRILLLIPFLLAFHAQAQPDTLYVPSGDSIYAFAIVYDPVEPAEQYKMIGRYAHQSDRIAVSIDFKRGKPSGIYRAWYPNGTPLIFAVYGWGSLNGDWTEYDEFGKVATKGKYRDGLREGTWAFRKEGIVGSYSKGLKHGKWKYYSNGRLIRIEKYRNGEPAKGESYNVG